MGPSIISLLNHMANFFGVGVFLKCGERVVNERNGVLLRIVKVLNLYQYIQLV